MPSHRIHNLLRVGRLLAACGGLLLVAAAVMARSAAAEGPPAAVEEVAPEIYYLRDEGGQLVPVPGFRYRDFVDLLRLKEGLPGLPEPPSSVLEKIAVQGKLPEAARSGESVCELSITLTVRQSRAGWVSVPLELGGFIITAAPRHEGEGRCFVDVDPQGRGYRGWLDGAANALHTIVLVGNAAIESTPVSESFRLHLPNATASLLELRTPRSDPEVVVRPASLPPRIGKPAEGSGSTVACDGLSGQVQVIVGDREQGVAAGGAAPQSTVESLVRIDGRVAVTEAVIRLENLPSGRDTLRIRLPPRATLKQLRPPAMLVERVGGEEETTAVVRIDRVGDGRATVELECERPVDPSGATPFDPQGFAVEGIPPWRQRGRTSLVAEGDWQLEWDELGINRRVDPPPAARRPGFVAAFAYDAQPAALAVRVRPRGSRIVVEPEYRYEIGATRISLDARLRVSVRGAPIARIVVGLEGWGIDEVEPAGLVDTAAISGESSALSIPFQQPLSGDALIEIRCGRAIERSQDRIGWKMPVPRADLVGPASVVILSATDIEVLPDNGAIRGLVRQVAPASRRDDGDRIALAYRLDGTDGFFAATRRFLARRVDAGVSVQATIDESDTVVEQVIRLDVSHVPLEFIDLRVPASVARTETLELRQGGQVLNPFEPPATAAGGPADAAGHPASEAAPRSENPSDRPAEPNGDRQLRALLPVPLLGTGECLVRFTIPTATIPPETTVAEDLPLVMPAGVRIARQTFSVVAKDPLAIEVRGDAWNRDLGQQPTASQRTWTAGKPQEFVPLAVSARQQAAFGETVVEAAWLETRLLPDRRDDVFTYSIASSAERIALSLPAGFIPLRDGVADPAAVEVRLDGELVRGAVRADGRVMVEQPRSAANAAGGGARLLTLESSRSRWSADGTWGGIPGMPTFVRLEPPLFPEGTLLRRFYWELRLESDEHVVVPPRRWTSQQHWGWDGWWLDRIPIVSRDVLAAWVGGNTGLANGPPASGPGAVGATAASSDPPLAERRAVFSGVGSPGTSRVLVVPTWLLVLAVSGPVLAVGLAMVYRPTVRRPAVVVSIAAGLAMAAAAVPDLIPLAALSAAPGVALSLLAAGLHALVNRTARPARPVFMPAVSSDTSTRFLPNPSIVIASSAIQSPGSRTATGRSAS
jgi:hypothetical protein